MRGLIWSAMHPELGFEQDRLAAFRVAAEDRSHEGTLDLRLHDPDGPVDRIRGLAGVRAATVADAVPQPSRPTLTVASTGTSAARSASRRMAVGPDFFKTLGVGLVRGREITAEDCRAGRRVVVASETLAHTLWPGEDPLGQPLALLDDDGQPETTLEIVGVAPDLAYTALNPLSRHAVYLPLPAAPDEGADLLVLVRVIGDLGTVAPAVAALLGSTDHPARRSEGLRPLGDLTESTHVEIVFVLDLLGAVGLLTLLLAVVGVVAVTVESVWLHTRELGIRAALGAAPGDLVGLVLKGSLVKVGLGAALGLPGPLLYNFSNPPTGVAPSAVLANPRAWALIGAAVLLMGLTSYLAARGAAHADPATAMRAE